jgi:hypothetical protein
MSATSGVQTLPAARSHLVERRAARQMDLTRKFALGLTKIVGRLGQQNYGDAF